VVAIGGIKLAQLEDVARYGAKHCAIVTALTSAADPGAATREHLGAWRSAKERAPRR
jgi:thiamine monophosphate synthase